MREIVCVLENVLIITIDYMKLNVNFKKSVSLSSIFILFSIVYGCDKQVAKNDETSTNISTNSDASINIMKNTNLAVDPVKCIGCGKCARIANKNFQMQMDTHKATVISQEIASQNAISQAVRACPTHAITQ